MKVLISTCLLFLSIFLVTAAQARHMCLKKETADTAMCVVNTTNAALPTYICCQLTYPVHYKKHGRWHTVWRTDWRQTWVPSSCANADARASGDKGCTMDSPVFGRNSPIIGSCQFSGKILN